MSRLRIRHSTGFTYEGDVSASYNEARMLPVAGDRQFVLYSHLDIEPMATTHEYLDYWGTKVTAFELLSPHRELTLTASSLVEVRESPESTDNGIGWDALPERAEHAVDLVESIEQTRLTEPPTELVERCETLRALHTPGEAARELLRMVYDEIQYQSGVTGVRTTAREAWQLGRGVCQDISHIALGALRAMGIPARYVSGYLHPKPNAPIGETVTGESHAWVEYWDGSWRGWDPTNNVPIGERHVEIARGRDYNDVPPLRGVYAGGFSSKLFVTVEITREA